MGIIVAIILGGLAGWVASKLMGRDAQMGALANIAVGVVGAFVGNLVASLFGGGDVSIKKFSLSGFLVALLGAVILLALLNLVTRKKVR